MKGSFEEDRYISVHEIFFEGDILIHWTFVVDTATGQFGGVAVKLTLFNWKAIQLHSPDLLTISPHILQVIFRWNQ